MYDNIQINQECDWLKPGSGSNLVNLIVVWTTGQKQIADDMKNFAEQLKVAMPVSSGQNYLHLPFYPCLSSETYLCKYEKLPNVV